MISHYIIYVLDQEKSSRFYEKVLALKPILEVPGMTEFQLSENSRLGIMPYSGVNALFGNSISTPKIAQRNPNSELYVIVENPEEFHLRSIKYGGKEISKMKAREWGHFAGYSKDIDGHILAFAKVQTMLL